MSKILIDEATVKLALDHSEPSILSPGWTLVRNEDIAALREALAEQPAQQEPVGYVAENGLVDWNLCAPPIFTDLYTSPSNQPGYQAMAMAVTRLQKRCLELEGKQPAQQEPVGVKFNEGMWQERESRIAQLEDELMRMQGRELKLQFALAEQPAPEPVFSFQMQLRPGWGGQYPRAVAIGEPDIESLFGKVGDVVTFYASPQPAQQQQEPLQDEAWKAQQKENADYAIKCATDVLEEMTAQQQQDPVAVRAAIVVNLVRDGINKHRAKELADHFIGLAAPQPAQRTDDTKRLDALAENSWDLRCFDMPTGAGDGDIGWRVIEHHMAKPYERTAAEVFRDDPRQAIDAAIEAAAKTKDAP